MEKNDLWWLTKLDEGILTFPQLHIQIPPDQLRTCTRSLMVQYRWGCCKLKYRWGTLRSYCMHSTPVTVAAAYP